MTELAARFLRPTRARLPEALAALTDASVETLRSLLARSLTAQFGLNALEFAVRTSSTGWERVPLVHTDPAAAWETFASRGILPADWTDDQRRAFEAPVGTHPAVLARRVPWAPMALSHPPTLGGCVAFAADPTGVLTAEAVARELCARRPAMHERAGDRVLWRVLDPLAVARKRAIYDRTIDRIPPPWPEFTAVIEAGYLFLSANASASLLAAAEWG